MDCAGTRMLANIDNRQTTQADFIHAPRKNADLM